SEVFRATPAAYFKIKDTVRRRSGWRAPGRWSRSGVGSSKLLTITLLSSSSRPIAQGGILNLNKMIKQVTGKVPFFSYWPYGCHCGIGGRGEPKDATDWCCHAHDCCYSHLKGHGCRTHLDHYRYT
uniref:Phospholipase A2 n=1 Tax=Sus scrofa TaxID=9823 RepID=A0A8D0R5M1_PIG